MPPDSDLAPLKGFPPLDLKVDTDLGRFVLVLAAIFNDLKNGSTPGTWRSRRKRSPSGAEGCRHQERHRG